MSRVNDPEPRTIPTGMYRHNKTGNLYEVLGTALQTETNEFLVVYRAAYSSQYELFARPIDMFLEQVELYGELKPRFEEGDD